MRLRAGLRVLRRSADEVQVGLDPRWAVRLTDLAPAEVDLLADRDDLDDLPPRLQAIAQQLVPAGLAVPDGASAAGPAADDPAWGLLRPDDLPATRARRRADACVGVIGLGPTGVGIAVALAAAGVGTVLLDDERPVLPADVGAYRWADVGAVREQAAARALRDVAPGVAIDVRAQPDVLVVVESLAADPGRGARVMATGVTHLSVVVREADTVVGPLVVPGAGACLRCLDLHRGDLDPAWPMLLGQLTGRGPTNEPGPVAAVAAGLAAATVLTVLDGLAPTLGRTWEIGLPDAVPRERTWAVHRDCGCAALPDPGARRP